MKNLKAMGIAFLLFLCTITAVRFAFVREMPEYNLKYGTWVDDSKFASSQALKKLLEDEESIAVFGSSELRHSQKSGFHADSVFKNSDMEPVFIGKGGYQSLIHAITLGAVGNPLTERKVVLSVSPQWFKADGVKKNAFGASYSESNFIAFLQNPEIDDATKQYVIERIRQLTDENPAMWGKVRDDVRWYLENENNLWDTFRKGIHSYITADKSDIKLFLRATKAGVLKKKQTENQSKTPNWEKLLKKAKKKGQKETGENTLGMLDRIYDKKYKKRIEENQVKKPRYSVDSVEFQDLECFLEICKAQKIEVMMIMLPFNGRWCDYLNLEKEERDGIYDQVRAIAEANHVQLADLSEYEYSEYMFEDESHLALKGLVMFNEEIYNFYKQNKDQ